MKTKQKRLDAKARGGAFWIGAEFWIKRGFFLLTLLILTRVLSPSELGTATISLAIWEILSLITQFGIDSAIISQQSPTKQYLNSAFWLSVILGTVIAVVGSATSPLLSRFFELPLTGLIIILLLALSIRSLATVHWALLLKQMEYARYNLALILLHFLRAVFMITLALAGAGTWSLVMPELLIAPLSTFVVWQLIEWRPGSPRLTGWRKIINFSGPAFGSQVLAHLNFNTDYLVIGKLLGPQILGIYSLAYRVVDLPLAGITRPFAQASFPTLAKLQKNKEGFCSHYLSLVRIISFISFPVFTGLFFAAPEFISIVFGQKWSAAITPLRLLTPYAAIRSITAVGGWALLALGLPQITFAFNAFIFPLTIAGLVISAQFGLLGVAAGLSLIYTIRNLIFQNLTLSSLKLSWRHLITSLIPASTSSATMFLTLSALNLLLPVAPLKDLIRLVTTTILGGAVYFVSLKIFFPQTIQIFWKSLKNASIHITFDVVQCLFRLPLINKLRYLIPPQLLRWLKYQKELHYWQTTYTDPNHPFYWQNNQKSLREIFERYCQTLQIAQDTFKNEVVVDVGCGPKGSLHHFQAKKKYGVEPLTPKYRQLFDLSGHDLTYLNCPAEAIDLPTNSVDSVISLNALDHVESFEKAVNEIFRILKPGGRIILSLNHQTHPTITEPHIIDLNRLKKALNKKFFWRIKAIYPPTKLYHYERFLITGKKLA
jgi:teichuronic acid exporter